MATPANLTGPAAAAVARHRSDSQDHGQTPAPMAVDMSGVSGKLAHISSLLAHMDLNVLRTYNEGWEEFLTTNKADIVAHALCVRHKKEDIHRVWDNLINEFHMHKAIMMCMHSQWNIKEKRECNLTLKDDVLRIVVDYFHEKTTFRRKVNTTVANIREMIRNAEIREKRGYDPSRMNEFNARCARVTAYRKHVHTEIAANLRHIEVLKACNVQLLESIDKFDEKVTEVKAAIAPPDAVRGSWIREFARLDRRTQDDDFGGVVENYVSKKERAYVDEKMNDFLNDDAAWANFANVDTAALKRALAARLDAALERDRTDFAQEVKRAFPGFDESRVEAPANPSGADDSDD